MARSAMTSAAVPPWPKRRIGPKVRSLPMPARSSNAFGRLTIASTAKPLMRARPAPVGPVGARPLFSGEGPRECPGGRVAGPAGPEGQVVGGRDRFDHGPGGAGAAGGGPRAVLGEGRVAVALGRPRLDRRGIAC